MYCPKKLKLNKFVDVAIPKNSDFFARLAGARPEAPSGAYTGDDILPVGMTKTELLASISEKDLNQIRKEAAEARNEDAESE